MLSILFQVLFILLKVKAAIAQMSQFVTLGMSLNQDIDDNLCDVAQ